MSQDQAQGKKERDADVSNRIDSYFETPQPSTPSAEQVQQPEPMPSSEQKPTETPQKEEAQPLQSDEEERVALENSKNPERTKSYIEKLKAENAKLKETKSPEAETQVSPQDYGDSVFDVLRPKLPATQPQVVPQMPQVDLSRYPGLNPLQAQNIAQQFVDEAGNVDVNGLNRALSDAHQRATQATQRVQSLEQKLERFEESQQVKEAHTFYPQLDPKNKGFDPKFFELVRDRLVRNMWEGKKATLAQVAADVQGFYQPPVNRAQVREEVAEELKQKQQARIQGPIEQGRGEDRRIDAPYDRNRKRSLDNPEFNQRLQNYFNSQKKP